MEGGAFDDRAGTPPSQATLDRPWRIWATIAVVILVAVGALIAFVIIPAGQRENAHLTMSEAMGRAAEPWEVANVIVFLASDYSTYMTGEIVSVSSQHP